MGENLGMESYLKEIIIIIGQLAAIGVTINNDDLLQIIFNVLTNIYDAFIQFVSIRHEYPTFDELVKQFIHKNNQQLLCYGHKHEEEAFFVKTKPLLKVMMKMTSPTSDGGPTSIAVHKDLDARMF
jgi:hypothetical protein